MMILTKPNSDGTNNYLVYNEEFDKIDFQLISLFDQKEEELFNSEDLFFFLNFDKDELSGFIEDNEIEFPLNYIDVIMDDDKLFNLKNYELLKNGLLAIAGSKNSQDSIKPVEKIRRLNEILSFLLITNKENLKDVLNGKIISFDTYVDTYPVKSFKELSILLSRGKLLSVIRDNGETINTEKEIEETEMHLKTRMQKIVEKNKLAFEKKEDRSMDRYFRYPMFFQLRNLKIKRLRSIAFQINQFFSRKINNYKGELKKLKEKMDAIDWLDDIQEEFSNDINGIHDSVKNDIKLNKDKVQKMKEINNENRWYFPPKDFSMRIFGPGSFSIIAVVLILLLSLIGIKFSEWIPVGTAGVLILYTLLYWFFRHRKFVKRHNEKFTALYEKANGFFNNNIDSIRKLYYKFFLDNLIISYIKRGKDLEELLKKIDKILNQTEGEIKIFINEVEKENQNGVGSRSQRVIDLQQFIEQEFKDKNFINQYVKNINRLEDFDKNLEKQCQLITKRVLELYAQQPSSSIYSIDEAESKVRNYRIYYPDVFLKNTGKILLFYSFNISSPKYNELQTIIKQNIDKFYRQYEVENEFIESGCEGILIGEILNY